MGHLTAIQCCDFKSDCAYMCTLTVSNSFGIKNESPFTFPDVDDIDLSSTNVFTFIDIL